MDIYSSFNAEIGINAKRIRLLMGLSQREVAERAGIPLDQSRVSHLEKGQRDWLPRYLRAISEALGVPPHALLDPEWVPPNE